METTNNKISEAEIEIAMKHFIESNINKATGKYNGLDNYKKPKANYLSKVICMTDAELMKECEDKIWLSAYASNNPRSDYHFQCDACYDECDRRKKVDAIYSKAYKKVEQSI